MLKCDFCGKIAESVKRVVIDKDYDRLTERHVKKYACSDCSARKEMERTRGAGKVSRGGG